MSRKQGIIVSITGIVLVSLMLIGLTYGYFLTRINGNTNTKSISVKTANLALVYGDGNGVLEVGEVLSPGDTVKFKTAGGDTVDKKTFTVTNEGNAKTDYVVVIEDVSVTYTATVVVDGETHTAGTSTTFQSNDFVYKLTCTSGCNGVDKVTTFPINGGILVGNSIDVGEEQTYELSMTYLETGLDQSSDMNKTMTARVNIKDISTINPYSSSTNSLAYNIINNAILKTNGIELLVTPKTLPAKDTSLDTEASLNITNDELGTSYYYRGAVEDNYLEFNNMCWRIVRIEGDGAIKITLAAQKKCSEITSSDTGTAFIGTGHYGVTYDYVTNSSGATSSSKKYVADYVNGQTNNTTSMKYKLEAWLTSSGIDKNKLKEDSWCLGNATDPYDNSGALLTSIANDLMYNGTEFFYDTYIRLYGKGQTANATLRCDGKNYKTHKSYIGALTADEVVFAGGKAGTGNSNYYLTENASNWWRTISLANFSGDFSRAFRIGSDGIVYDGPVNSGSLNLRPAVSLASGTVITGGNGTQTKPYVVG